MTLDQIKGEISRLGYSEKLHLVEEIWDPIAESDSNVPVHAWQKAELDKRYQDYLDGNVILREWSSVHDEIRSKYL